MNQEDKNKQSELMVRKANNLISAKYKASALEQKLIALSLTRLNLSDGTPTASMTTKDIAQFLHYDTTNIYRMLRKAAVMMLGGSVVVIEDPDNKEFLAFNMITTARFKKGVFTIDFNKELTPFINDLKGSYTTYQLEMLAKLESPFSIRMYELLKKEAYKIKGKFGSHLIEMPLAQLKYELGALSLTEKEVADLRLNHASWEEIEEKSVTSSYKRWDNFKKRVLMKAQEELKSATDLCFDFDPVRGAHGTVKAVKFTIRYNTKMEDEILKVYIGHNGLTQEDLELLLNEADGDSKKVEASILAADKQPHISNYVGWIRSCIKGDYRDAIEVVHGDAMTAQRITNIQKSIQEVSEDDVMFKNMWDKIRNREDFFEFEKAIFPMPIEEFEDMYSFKERVDEYYSWKKRTPLA